MTIDEETGTITFHVCDEDEHCDSCTLCDGPIAYLGQLGRRTWFRCIACGLEQSSTSRA